MKPRRVIVTLEVETALPVEAIKRAKRFTFFDSDYIPTTVGSIEQIHVNVIKPRPKSKRRK